MENFKKNIYFDIRTISITRLGLMQKIDLILSKYLALLGILLRNKGVFNVGRSQIKVRSIGDVGTIHSSIVDFYDDIVMSHTIKKLNPTIVDIGANIGQFTSAVKLFYPEAIVHAFEPDKAIFEQLESNLARYSDIKLYNVGIGEKDTIQTFYHDDLSVKSTFKKHKNSHVKGTSEVRTVTLDSINVGSLDLLKIDVEGFEKEVISGSKNTIKSSDYLLMELSLDRNEVDPNIKLLSEINKVSSTARLIKFGRPLGKKYRPVCQDVLIRLKESA